MSLICIDRHILEILVSSIHEDFEALAAVNKSLRKICTEYIASLSRSYNFGTSKLYNHQLLTVKWLDKYIRSNRDDYNLFLRAEPSYGKSIIGITACLLHLQANPKGVCMIFIPNKATDDMMHECKKHFSAQLKSKTILFYNKRYVSYGQIAAAFVEDITRMHGKILIICVNDNKLISYSSIFEHATFSVLDEGPYCTGMIYCINDHRKADDKLSKILYTTAAKSPHFEYAVWTSSADKCVPVCRKPHLEIEFELINEDNRLSDLLSKYSASHHHMAFVHDNNYKLDDTVNVITHQLVHDNNYKVDYTVNVITHQYVHITKQVRTAFGFKGGILFTHYKTIPKINNLNECSVMFLSALYKQPMELISEAISKLHRGSNINSTVKIVFIGYERCESLTSNWTKYKLTSLNYYVDHSSWINNVNLNDLKLLLSKASHQLTINILTCYKYTLLDTDALVEAEHLSKANVSLIRKMLLNGTDDINRHRKFDNVLDSKKLYMLIKLLTTKK